MLIQSIADIIVIATKEQDNHHFEERKNSLFSVNNSCSNNQQCKHKQFGKIPSNLSVKND